MNVKLIITVILNNLIWLWVVIYYIDRKNDEKAEIIQMAIKEINKYRKKEK